MHNIQNKENPCFIIYFDDQNHSKNYIWQNSYSTGGLKVPVCKGCHLILSCVESAWYGFINNAKLLFQSRKSGDFHYKMDAEVFTDLLCRWEECVWSSYHSTCKEKVPTSNTKKPDIRKWLKEKNIDPGSSVTKLDLLNIVQQHSRK